MGAAGCGDRIGDMELAVRNPIGDQTRDDDLDAHDVAVNHRPAFGHGGLHHLVHAAVGRELLRAHVAHGRKHMPQPRGGRAPGSRGDPLEFGVELIEHPGRHRFVDRLLRVEEAVHVGWAHAERLGEVGHRGLAVTDLAEEPLRHLQDQAARVARSPVGDGCVVRALGRFGSHRASIQRLKCRG